MTATVHVEEKYQSSRPTIIVHETELPIFEARLASVFVEKWGMVAGSPDGEDSSGRAKARLLTPAEVVERACETAASLTQAFRDRGWFALVPSWDEAKELARNSVAADVTNDVQRAADRAAARSAARSKLDDPSAK